MKQIQVTDQAATAIEDLRSNNCDALELVRVSVADGMSVLAGMLQVGRDCPEIGDYADDLLRVMFTLSEYNRLIDMLVNDSGDRNPARYYLKDTWFHTEGGAK